MKILQYSHEIEIDWLINDHVQIFSASQMYPCRWHENRYDFTRVALRETFFFA
jgi:hypothetical protein